jgi:hypothetical protein
MVEVGRLAAASKLFFGILVIEIWDLRLEKMETVCTGSLD